MPAPTDPYWSSLVDELATHGEVAERKPFGLTVVLDRGEAATQVVEIVMTPDQWHDLVSIPFGSVESATEYVRELVLRQPAEARFLVYSIYDLEPCSTPTLPPDPDFLKFQELAARYPDGVIPGGGWFAHPPQQGAG